MFDLMCIYKPQWAPFFAMVGMVCKQPPLRLLKKLPANLFIHLQIIFFIQVFCVHSPLLSVCNPSKMKASEFRGFPGGLATGVLLSMIASLLWSTNPEPTTLRGPPPAPVCNPREAVKPSKFNEYLKARGNVTANCDLGSLSLSGCPPIHKRKPEISVCHVCERRHHAIRINKIPEGVVEVGADGRWLIVVQRLLFTDPKCQMKTAYVEHRRDAVVSMAYMSVAWMG